MKWSETILLSEPLRDVRRLTGAPPQGWDALLREREQAAFVHGRREGENALSQQLIEQRAEVAQMQHGILDSLRRVVPQVVQETEAAVIQLAFEAARKVVAGIPIDGALVEAVVRDALRQAEDTAEVIVQLHPDDLALLRQNKSPVLEGPADSGPVRFSVSSEVAPGGCVIQTRFGLIDARREVKFEQLQQTLGA